MARRFMARIDMCIAYYSSCFQIILPGTMYYNVSNDLTVGNEAHATASSFIYQLDLIDRYGVLLIRIYNNDHHQR